MKNLQRNYPQIPEKVRCRCNLHVRQAEKHLQVRRKASCRYVGPKKSICNSKYQGLADTTAAKKASATVNIKALQIHQLPKEHLRKQITESPPLLIVPSISITVHLQERKDYALQRIGVGLARRS